MSAPGNRAGLNLGPLWEAGGRWVGLNLGVDWWSEEPPEPPARDLRAATSLGWKPARSIRGLAVVGWGRSEVARRSVSPAWERAEPTSSGPLALDWGLSALLRQSDTLAWRGWQPWSGTHCRPPGGHWADAVRSWTADGVRRFDQLLCAASLGSTGPDGAGCRYWMGTRSTIRQRWRGNGSGRS